MRAAGQRASWTLALLVTLLGAGALAGCGSTEAPPSVPAVGEPAAHAGQTIDADSVEDCSFTLVPASEVTVVGTLTSAEREMAEWALSRFAAADLELPSTIEVGFDPTRARCGGARGLCVAGDEPPAAIVCEREGETTYRVLNRRITLLHELAHIWHGAGPELDAAAIVGGSEGDDVPWSDKTHERVATVVSWGLLDQPRRPVSTGVPCVDMYRQFEALTGSPPLGPLEPLCLPDVEPAG